MKWMNYCILLVFWNRIKLLQILINYSAIILTCRSRLSFKISGVRLSLPSALLLFSSLIYLLIILRCAGFQFWCGCYHETSAYWCTGRFFTVQDFQNTALSVFCFLSWSIAIDECTKRCSFWMFYIVVSLVCYFLNSCSMFLNCFSAKHLFWTVMILSGCFLSDW